MAMTYGDATYSNKLKALLEDPASFQKTPGFQFALDTGLGALQRSNSKMRGSGNALAALTQYGTGLANQEYGSQLDRLGNLSGQEQQYDVSQTSNANTLLLGQEANRNTATRNTNDLSLGREANANTRQRNDYDYTLGSQANSNNAQRNKWDYEIGGRNADNVAGRNAADYDLGGRQIDAGQERAWWDHSDAQDRLGLDYSRAENDFNLNSRRNDLDWFNANTNRGTARSGDYYRGREEDRLRNPPAPRRVIY